MTDYVYSWGFRVVVRDGKVMFIDRGASRIIDESFIGVRGEGSINTDALKYLIRNGLEFSFLSNKGYVKLFCCNSHFRNLNLKLLKTYFTPEARLKFVFEVVSAAALNKVWILKKYNLNSDLICEFEDYVSNLLSMIGITIEYLSIEAQIAKKYYELLRNIIPVEIGFRGRIRRPPRDLFNSLLSYGNIYLYNLISFMLKVHGFDVRIGLLHKPFRNRISLALDMAENFRQVVVDSTALSIVTTNSFKLGTHYKVDRNAVYLTKRGRRNFLKMIRFKIYESKIYGKPVYDHIHDQIHRLEDFLNNGEFRAFKIKY